VVTSLGFGLHHLGEPGPGLDNSSRPIPHFVRCLVPGFSRRSCRRRSTAARLVWAVLPLVGCNLPAKEQHFQSPSLETTLLSYRWLDTFPGLEVERTVISPITETVASIRKDTTEHTFLALFATFRVRGARTRLAPA
jgi:hypothetical protein